MSGLFVGLVVVAAFLLGLRAGIAIEISAPSDAENVPSRPPAPSLAACAVGS